MDIVSSCLVGIKCRYDGGEKTDPELQKRVANSELMPICPEQLGGLPTPRPPAELKDNKYLTSKGHDLSENYLRGAAEAFKLAKLCKAKTAYLKANSPMCGAGKIYDGSFSGKKIEGDGAFTKLLTSADIKIISID